MVTLDRGQHFVLNYLVSDIALVLNPWQLGQSVIVAVVRLLTSVKVLDIACVLQIRRRTVMRGMRMILIALM